MNDIQREMISNLKEKNALLAVVHSTKASLHEVTMKATTLEEEKRKLQEEKERRLHGTAHSHIDGAKAEIDACIHQLDQKINQLNSEIVDLRNKEKEYKTELGVKERN